MEMLRFTKILMGLAGIVTAATISYSIGKYTGEAKAKEGIVQILEREACQAERNAAACAELRPGYNHPPQFYESMRIAEIYKSLAENVR